MRRLLIVLVVLGISGLAFAGYRLWQVFPKPSTEVITLTSDQRTSLQRLRNEAKFGPHDYPPLGYTGAETPEDAARATGAVDAFIDAVLAQDGGVVHARKVSGLMGGAMRKVELLATEDRERTGDYLVEVWYILGFKGPTGRFASGAGFQRAPGYAEPLPPGWTAPDKPRPIG